jgi:pimeloyl-ACP methyl ester carboxylesterase
MEPPTGDCTDTTAAVVGDALAGASASGGGPMNTLLEHRRFETNPRPALSRRGCRGFLVALVVLVYLAIVAPVSVDATTGGGSPTPARAGPPPIGWTACGPRLECATVSVPLDWRHPGGPTIALAVIRHLASRPDRRIGSLFVNPGGPGDSGVAAVANRGDALDNQTGGRFDIVGWDPRGAGGSAPVSCFADPAERAAFWQDQPVPTTRREERRYLARTIALAQRCGERNGELLAHVSTTDTVRDLDHLRRLVGDRQLTFLGESTGTLIGLTYANLFPRRVRAMVLDGLEDPVRFLAGTASALAQSFTDTDRTFRQLLRLCEAAGPDRCALAGHGTSAAERAKGVLERLRQHPIPAPSATPPGELTYGEALTLLKFAVLPTPAIWPQAAALLEAAAQGDASALEDIARGYASEEFHRGLEPGIAILCADSPARQDAHAWPRVVHRLEAVSRIGAAPQGWAVGAPCASWPTRGANRYTGPWNATTPNPILLVGTRFDPNTPLVNARIAERRLGNAALLTHDGYGHLSSADPSSCVLQATGRYLVHGSTPPPGTVCPSDRLPFDPEFGQPVP